jgi:copper chaperone
VRGSPEYRPPSPALFDSGHPNGCNVQDMNTPHTHELQVQGMSCQHCVKAVTQAVQAGDADAQVTVDLPNGRVSVVTQLSRDATAAAITAEGYDVLS